MPRVLSSKDLAKGDGHLHPTQHPRHPKNPLASFPSRSLCGFLFIPRSELLFGSHSYSDLDITQPLEVVSGSTLWDGP